MTLSYAHYCSVTLHFNSQALAGEIKLVQEDIGLPTLERFLQTHRDWETEGSIPGVTKFHYSERGYGHSETVRL